ncbi:hypothetical protein EG867_15920, partial [Enterococcus faecalis]
ASSTSRSCTYARRYASGAPPAAGRGAARRNRRKVRAASSSGSEFGKTSAAILAAEPGHELEQRGHRARGLVAGARAGHALAEAGGQLLLEDVLGEGLGGGAAARREQGREEDAAAREHLHGVLARQRLAALRAQAERHVQQHVAQRAQVDRQAHLVRQGARRRRAPVNKVHQHPRGPVARMPQEDARRRAPRQRRELQRLAAREAEAGVRERAARVEGHEAKVPDDGRHDHVAARAHKDVAALDVQVAEPAAVEEHERAPELGEDAPQGVHHVPGARRERAAVRVHVHLVGREHELAQRRREPHQAHHAADAGGARRLRGQQRHDGLVAEAGAERLHGHRAVHEHAAVRAGPDGHGVAREVEGRVLQVVRHGEVPVRARDQVGGL